MRKLILIAVAFALLTAPAWGYWDPSMPHKMHFPQMPDELGWDVMATFPIVLAEDWQCSETGIVKDVHFWGSWRDFDGDQLGDVGTITSFWISFHTNNPGPPSQPGELIFEGEIWDFHIQPIDPPAMQGWYNPETGEVIPDNHIDYWQYNIDLPPEFWFTQTAGEIYWVNISAMVAEPDLQWGWKSTLDHFMDDAVWGHVGTGDWQEMYDPMPEPPLEDSFMAQFGPGGEFTYGWGSDPEYPDWYWYPNTGWWNVWFYDHPLVTGKKNVWINFFAQGVYPGTYMALNWSTDQWEPGGPPPLPPLSPEEEDLFIGRDIRPIVEGLNDFYFQIPFYNPEWVSVDIMTMEGLYIEGTIRHQCIPSLDLSLVITGEPAQGEIPTLNEWGMIILALLLLLAGTIAVVRRRKTAAARAR